MFVTPVRRALALGSLTLLCASLPVQARPLAQQAPLLCDLVGETAAVFGSVSDEISQVPLPGVRVTATWEIHRGQEDPNPDAAGGAAPEAQANGRLSAVTGST